MLVEQRRGPLAGDLSGAGQNLLDPPEGSDEGRGGLGADPRNPGNVVHRIPDKAEVVRHPLGRHLELGFHPGGIKPLRGVRRRHDADPIVHELEQILVAGDDQHPVPSAAPGPRQGSDHIVRLHPGDLDHRHSQHPRKIPRERNLPRQFRRHLRPVRLVFRVGLVTEGGARRVERHRCQFGGLLAQDLSERRHVAVERAVRQAVRPGQPGHREERTEQQVVAVHQQERRFGHRERRPGFYGRAGSALILAAGLGCAPAAWEEHHRLALDGSGRSVILISPDLAPDSETEDPAGWLGEALSRPGVTVTRTRSRRDGRIEAEVAFDSLRALCDAPLLRRECSLRPSADGGFELAMSIAARPRAQPRPAAAAEVRMRTEGRITAHNSDGPLQRGNVLSWSRPLDEFLGDGLEVRVRTDGTSIFAATTRIVLRSALIALGIVGTGLVLLVLEGRRRLRREGRPSSPG